ncbi:lysophospholipid acyltransferase family protein [Salinisphaera orenii]|nr:lysophospholipid acyltransferase family protein [Salinisphaera halophila]
MAEQPERPDPARDRRRASKPRKPPTWRQRMVMRVAAWACIVLVWVYRLTCRIEVVHGAEHVRATLDGGRPVVPCGWHQRIVPSGLFLRTLIPRGLRLGFLISPSREGEFLSRVALAHGATTIRGSSSRTGQAAMQALVQAVGEGISPTMYGDGPRGPAGVFKVGAAILASRSGAPLFLVGCAADRYWQLKSWDSGHIPKPFARLTVAVGEPWSIGALTDDAHADRIAREIGERLDTLNELAEAAQTGHG